ncbi:MAG: beta-glucuronidase [Fidelibacterota bacterium]|nr:MAG: beta-glucuronidase [Candidatus Neomarinimicrobiota bacterium]
MLYPQNNRCRTVMDLSGFWDLKVDAAERGLEDGWSRGIATDLCAGVPGSWNEQLSELGLMNYIGSVWYQTHFTLPTFWTGRKLILRFGSVDHHATVWVNGESAGEHRGGFLPFELDITDLVQWEGENVLVVRANNVLSHDTIPQGVSEEDYADFGKERDQTFPPANFDFFPYGGIPRPVKLLALPPQYISAIRVQTRIVEKAGQLKFAATLSEEMPGAAIKAVLGDGDRSIASQEVAQGDLSCTGEMQIPECRFWSPESPHLYRLHLSLRDGDTLLDEYQLEVGIREITVEGKELLLNGKPVFLQGFGKHEDFPVLGKGFSYPLVVKDFQLMNWIGANSFRTSHYPYADELMQLADQMGFLVVDEVPAVSLNLKYATDQTLQQHKQALTELITRDRNHPSVIAWSVGNEAGIWGEAEAVTEKGIGYWKDIFQHTRELDDSRPITLPTCVQTRDVDPAYLYSDFISVNRYWGWYEIPVKVDEAVVQLKSELEGLYKRYGKPILLSEFGADTIEGQHATYPQMFTEEYQSLLLAEYFKVIDSLPFMIGEHIWNFADFRTAQHHRRIILNKKGVFNRQREPKQVAFAIRDRWCSKSIPGEKSGS